MKLTTAGESHGKALVAILEGLPAHLKIDLEQINKELSLRQSGFGRGGRQKIEKDGVEILTGVRNGETLGSPVTLCIYNKDYANWENCMSDKACDEEAMLKKALTKVRPGHADLTGVIKYAQTDARNVLERASARET
ncbi:MAG: chorismate synthase, partial [Clostridiales bacterium]|nr:chorismate synthase [Clostridiales bacterium]